VPQPLRKDARSAEREKGSEPVEPALSVPHVVEFDGVWALGILLGFLVPYATAATAASIRLMPSIPSNVVFVVHVAVQIPIGPPVSLHIEFIPRYKGNS